MSSQSRIGAIDILKGLIITAILFLNIMFLGNQPLWTGGTGAPEAVYYIAAILFPALIFLIGMTVPFSVTKRINAGLTSYDIVRHIFARSLILIAVGVLIVNTTRVEPSLTGFGKNLWAILLYAGIFLTWNRYPEKENNFFTTNGLRLAGLALLVFIVFRFRSGTLENNGSLVPGWWELPGLAGWGYLVAGMTYLVFRNSLAGTISVWLLFLALNILNQLHLVSFLDPVKPYFGVLLDGYIPFIILSGQLAGILVKKYSATEIRKPLIIIVTSGILLSAAGVLLFLYYFSGDIFGNPAWSMISCGVTALLFAGFFWIDEGLKMANPAMILKPFGENMFTVYTIQLLLLSLAWLTGADIFFFLKQGALVLNIAGSIVWTLLILGISILLFRFGIKLKF